MLGWDGGGEGGGRRFTADELSRVGSRCGKPGLVRLALERGADNARTSSRRHHLPVDMKRAREEDASPGASGAGGGPAAAAGALGREQEASAPAGGAAAAVQAGLNCAR